MRYYVDTEFIDDGKTIDLISIGIMAEDGREYYAQSVEFASENASPWVVENVYPHLSYCSYMENRTKVVGGKGSHAMISKAHHFLSDVLCPLPGCPWRTREQIRDEIITFFGTENFDLYGWCSAYDFVALCQLFGTMMQLPAFYPHYINDLQQELDERGTKDEELPEQEKGLHNALADARHIRHLWGVVCGHYAAKDPPILPPYEG